MELRRRSDAERELYYVQRIAALEKWRDEAVLYLLSQERRWRYAGVPDTDAEMVWLRRLIAEAGKGEGT